MQEDFHNNVLLTMQGFDLQNMTRENFLCDQMLDLVLHPYALLVFSQSHQFHSPILLLWHPLMMIPLHYRKKVIWWLFYGENHDENVSSNGSCDCSIFNGDSDKIFMVIITMVVAIVMVRIDNCDDGCDSHSENDGCDRRR